MKAEPESDLSGQPTSQHLRRVGKALLTGSAVAAAPLLADLADLEPPWPNGIGKASAVSVVVASIVCGEVLASSGLKVRRTWTLVAAGLATFGLVSYLLLASLFIETSTDGSLRAIRGYHCTPAALIVYKEKCPDLDKMALQAAEWNATTLWTRGSVTTIRLLLVTSWLTFLLSAVVAVSSSVTGSRRRRVAPIGRSRSRLKKQ